MTDDGNGALVAEKKLSLVYKVNATFQDLSMDSERRLLWHSTGADVTN